MCLYRRSRMRLKKRKSWHHFKRLNHQLDLYYLMKMETELVKLTEDLG